MYLTIVLKRMEEKKNASRYIGADPAASSLSTVNLPWRLLANPFLLVSATMLLWRNRALKLFQKLTWDVLEVSFFRDGISSRWIGKCDRCLEVLGKGTKGETRGLGRWDSYAFKIQG